MFSIIFKMVLFIISFQLCVGGEILIEIKTDRANVESTDENK